MKTFEDIRQDKEKDQKALDAFVKLYNDTEIDKNGVQLIESVSRQIPDDMSAKEINTLLESAKNEGVVGGVLGGIAGYAFGSKIGAAICKALGITSGPLYQLLTSKLVTTAICAYLGVKA